MGQTTGKLITYTTPTGCPVEQYDDDDEVWDTFHSAKDTPETSETQHSQCNVNETGEEGENYTWHLTIKEVPVLLGHPEPLVEDPIERIELQQGLLKKECDSDRPRSSTLIKKHDGE
ncbi:unnamed protein product [Echinostoma caproni]|uniref:Anaphase-promoting complex subunit 13 n=1 Tax=Echinostoma caproni TaxID=27848 RepID=A0A183AD97_9TREM|nr:unnamed protein product [Echinostoma caproni]